VILMTMTGAFLHVVSTCGPGGEAPARIVGSPPDRPNEG
jgi:hypothetical protein